MPYLGPLEECPPSISGAEQELLGIGSWAFPFANRSGTSTTSDFSGNLSDVNDLEPQFPTRTRILVDRRYNNLAQSPCHSLSSYPGSDSGHSFDVVIVRAGTGHAVSLDGPVNALSETLGPIDGNTIVYKAVMLRRWEEQTFEEDPWHSMDVGETTRLLVSRLSY